MTEAAPNVRPDPAAFAGRHTPVPPGFDPARLRGLSEKLLRSHWESNYGGAVKALNAVEVRLAATLADPGSPPWLHGELKREELIRTGSVRLHECYFGNLGGDGEQSDLVRHALTASFGTVALWEEDFRRTAASLAGGSGWVLLARGPDGVLRNQWAWDHAHGAPGSVPLLVLDMYEHAYHLDYGAAASRYVDAFVQNADWEVVARRLALASPMDEAFRESRNQTWNPG